MKAGLLPARAQALWTVTQQRAAVLLRVPVLLRALAPASVLVRVAVRVLKQRVVSPPVAVWRVSVPTPVRASASAWERVLVSASCS